MSMHSPRGHFDASTPPLPPPKHSGGPGTPRPAPPLPESAQSGMDRRLDTLPSALPPIEPPEVGWLPESLKDKSTLDLQSVLSSPTLQQSLIHSPATAHPSMPASSKRLQTLLSDNLALATQLTSLESQIQHHRQATQSRLLSLRALEGQWRSKQSEQDAALRDFSAPALYQRLSAAVGEQEQLCRGLEESFIQADGDSAVAGEREVTEFVRRLKEARTTAYLRRERKERWDEGRIGGWRG